MKHLHRLSQAPSLRGIIKRRAAESRATVWDACRSISSMIPIAGYVSLLACSPLRAQISDAVDVDYIKGALPTAIESIAPLGTDLFGEKVNLYNGSVDLNTRTFRSQATTLCRFRWCASATPDALGKCTERWPIGI